MTVPKWVWILWVVSGLIIELIAIMTPTEGDTLTEFVVFLGAAAIWLMFVFGIWLAWHFIRRLDDSE